MFSLQPPRHIPTLPKSRRPADIRAPPLGATTGREQAQQWVCLGVNYSITSSARASNVVAHQRGALHVFENHRRWL